MTSLSRAVVPRSICSPKNHFAPWHTVRREVEKLSNERDKIKFIIFGLLKSVHIPHPTSQFSFLRKAKYVCLHGAIYAKLKASQGAFAGLCLNFLNVIQSIFGLASYVGQLQHNKNYMALKKVNSRREITSVTQFLLKLSWVING